MSDHPRPYLALWAKVFIQAIDDLTADSTAPYARAIRHRARRWFEGKEDGIGSFIWVCEQFDIDPAWARTKVFSLKARTTGDTVHLGTAIKDYRRKNKLTQRDLAMVIGCAQSTIGSIEVDTFPRSRYHETLWQMVKYAD